MHFAIFVKFSMIFKFYFQSSNIRSFLTTTLMIDLFSYVIFVFIYLIRLS